MFEFLESIAQWFNSGIYDWWTQATAYLMTEFLILYFKLKLLGLQFAWGIAQNVLANLGISQAIQSAWGGLSSDVAQAAAFFRVPEAFNILISAGATRLVMSFIPGM